MFHSSTARGLCAVSVACGFTLAALATAHASGEWLALWLGLVATTLVGASLCVLYLASRHVPALARFLAAASVSLKASLIGWSGIGVAALALMTALSEPSRLADLGLYAPIGLLYGAVSGLAYWQFSRRR